jgi:hypothetical protein
MSERRPESEGEDPQGGRVMANTAADVLIDVLREWGVDVIFGLPTS